MRPWIVLTALGLPFFLSLGYWTFFMRDAQEVPPLPEVKIRLGRVRIGHPKGGVISGRRGACGRPFAVGPPLRRARDATRRDGT